MVATHRGRRLFVLENSQLVVANSVALRVALKSAHRIGPTHHVHDRVDQVTGQLEHPAAFVAGQFPTQRRGGHLPHHRVDLHDIPQPALPCSVVHELKRRVVAQHVTHLYHPLFALGQVDQLPKTGQVQPSRFVVVNVHPGRDCPLGRGNQVGQLRLDRHRLQSRCRQ